MSNPMFGHRHYKHIAALIADTAETVTPEQLAERFASFFAADNSRFNRERFLAAAKGKPCNGRDRV
jgi:hypothetical protein